jgi:hypothetical protein
LLAVGASVASDVNRLTDPVRLLSVSDGSLITAFRGAVQPIKRIEWIFGGQMLAFADASQKVILWHPFNEHDGGIGKRFSKNLMSIAVSPEGERLAVADDNVVKI